MLRFSRACAWRWEGVPPSPNSRSKTMRGLFSVGSGLDGDRQASVFMYAQL
jgi:hypothetical protein